MTHDLVIKGGVVVDGTGADARTTDIAIDGDVIVEVGSDTGSARRVIDADGLLVTPGFVDIHCHYDGQATWDARLTPSSWHGVTTVVVGNCGVGFAPVRDADHERLIQLMEGVEDIPGAVLHEGLEWKWHSFPEFVDALEGRSFDVDVALQVPHGALRLHVMGERGAKREAATGEDIRLMGKLAAEAVDAGALGFTTSRTLNHRTSTGDFTPTLTAEADELIGIAEAIGATGRGVLQVVSDFADVDAEFGIFRRMAERSGRPLSFSLVQAPQNNWRRQLELLEDANREGVRMTGQTAPRPVGVLLGLECTLHPLLVNPVFREIAGATLPEQVAALSDASFSARLVEADHAVAGGRRLLQAWANIFVLDDPPNYEPDPSASIARRAEREGRLPIDLACDLLVADDGHGLLYAPILNYTDGNLDAVGEMLAHPNTVVGLGDGGAHVGTICDASFPTTLLTLWGRDRDRGRLPLPFLVHRQTQATARTVGLLDRGVLAPGFRADVNVIDFDRLCARRPEIRCDLPAGGRRFVQAADGYIVTIAGGRVTYEQGEPTEALPGRLIRGPQPAAAKGANR
jgi:N-acyl-D-aspartate/D-glutamate deacylase